MYKYREVFPVRFLIQLNTDFLHYRKPVESQILADHQQTTTGTRRLFQLPSSTRWFSVWTLLSTILKYENALKAAIWDSKLPHDTNAKKKQDELRGFICGDKSFWTQLKVISDILKPLARAIKQIEGSIVDARFAYHAVDSAFADCLKQVEKFDSEDQAKLKQVNFTI